MAGPGAERRAGLTLKCSSLIVDSCSARREYVTTFSVEAWDSEIPLQHRDISTLEESVRGAWTLPMALSALFNTGKHLFDQCQPWGKFAVAFCKPQLFFQYPHCLTLQTGWVVFDSSRLFVVMVPGGKLFIPGSRDAQLHVFDGVPEVRQEDIPWMSEPDTPLRCSRAI